MNIKMCTLTLLLTCECFYFLELKPTRWNTNLSGMNIQLEGPLSSGKIKCLNYRNPTTNQTLISSCTKLKNTSRQPIQEREEVTHIHYQRSFITKINW